MPSPPPPPTLNQLFQDAENLIHQAMPLLEDAYVFSQVLGTILKEANKSDGPPPTYYIGDAPDDPSSPSQPTPPSGQATTPVATLGDQAGGLQLESNGDFEVYVGGHPIATVSSASAMGAIVSAGNPTIGAGSGNLPVAGEGSPTAVGPVTDMNPNDNVYMETNYVPGQPAKHFLYTVAGTGATSPDQVGEYPYDLSQRPEVSPYFTWVGVNYPAATFPMGPSVDTGIQNLAGLIAANPGTFAISGYSQGAIVTCRVWRDYILNPDGPLHDRINDIIGHVTWGNPLRCPGIANGNGLVPIDMPTNVDGVVSGGIAGPDDLTPWQTPVWHIDFVHNGDLYADCPTGPDPWSNEEPAGQDETAIYELVQGQITGPDGILEVVGELLTNPIGEMIPLFEAIINGLQFLAANQAPHAQYGETMDAAANWLSGTGQMVPVRTT